MTIKKISLTFLAFIMLGSLAYAQENKDSKKEGQRTVAKSRDLFMLQLHYDNWNGTPDSVNMNGFNRGISGYFMIDFPFKGSNFSFAPGIGIGSYNYYFKDQRLIINEGQQNVEFRTLFPPQSDDYKKSKLATVYAEAPIELRFFADKYNRNKGFKAAIGMKIGYLLNAHTRDKLNVNGTTVVQKFATKEYFPTWTFSPTVRIGWGNISVFGQYSLSQQFTPGLGPEVFPWAVGITISGL